MKFKLFGKIKKWYSSLPDKKRWIDVITAVLTIPVLITVILANLSRIKEENIKIEEVSPTPIVIINQDEENPDQAQNPSITPVVTVTAGMGLSPTVTPVCLLDPEPYQITYPEEQEIVDVDPVCVVMESQGGNYCPTSWAYRVNNSTWSSYTNDSICLYNMREGAVKLEIRTKSTVSGREKTYVRNFTYQTEASLTPVLTPTLSPKPTES